MAESFIKHSPEELGEALEALARKELDNGQMLETLMRSTAYTLVDRALPESGEPDEDLRMVTVEDPRGEARMAGLFTSAEKAGAQRGESPGFDHVARVEVLWAFLQLDDGLGVLLDPGDERSFRIPPEVAANLKQAVQQAVNQ